MPLAPRLTAPLPCISTPTPAVPVMVKLPAAGAPSLITLSGPAPVMCTPSVVPVTSPARLRVSAPVPVARMPSDAPLTEPVAETVTLAVPLMLTPAIVPEPVLSTELSIVTLPPVTVRPVARVRPPEKSSVPPVTVRVPVVPVMVPA